MLTPEAILAECRRRADEAWELSSKMYAKQQEVFAWGYFQTSRTANSLADWIEREMRKEDPQ